MCLCNINIKMFMYSTYFISIYTCTTCRVYHASHLGRNLYAWKYRSTESKCLCFVQLKRRIKILEQKWAKECEVFRVFLFQLIKILPISDVLYWYLQIVLVPFSINWVKDCVFESFLKLGIIHAGDLQCWPNGTGTTSKNYLTEAHQPWVFCEWWRHKK